jgi:hypothetical protein
MYPYGPPTRCAGRSLPLFAREIERSQGTLMFTFCGKFKSPSEAGSQQDTFQYSNIIKGNFGGV